MLGSKDINTINNSDIYDTYKNLYLSKKNLKRSYFKAYSQPMCKGMSRCKKGRWRSTDSDNAGKGD